MKQMAVIKIFEAMLLLKLFLALMNTNTNFYNNENIEQIFRKKIVKLNNNMGLKMKTALRYFILNLVLLNFSCFMTSSMSHKAFIHWFIWCHRRVTSVLCWEFPF